MSYKLKFLPSALKEWEQLGATVQEQFKKKLGERLRQPIVPADRLRGQENYFKIKLRSSGYRLVYEVEETTVTVFVIALGKREKENVYRHAAKRNRP
ncbi:MAG: type II toxin-antitoxin system RelE/ParE family toxin [Opitutales bacterium]|nr:type II toxin-antitoxin system RelE/ParE family toxin [Opitutales bacterium]